MAYRLSVLDKVPVPEGATATEAFSRAVSLAQRAEALGYHRYWLAEHHAAPTLASSAPEIAAAYILARTQRIRVGAGGVLLQHYAPYKVAEVFKVLSALAPGRVDLGIGRAPGGLPPSTRALRRAGGDGLSLDFETKFRELDQHLSNAPLLEAPPFDVAALPIVEQGPERILLGASEDTAALAADNDWQFCFAGHFDGDPEKIAKVFDVYRKRSSRSPILAVFAAVADSEAEARRLAGDIKLFRVHLPDGRYVNLPNEKAAAEFARQAGAADYRLEPLNPTVIAGTGAQVRAELDRLHLQFGVEEFVIDNPIAAFAERLASYERLANSRQAAAA
jgi:luciferase family oxidoreductase group 1